MKHAVLFLLLVLALGQVAPSHAQDFGDPIATDRPGFGFAASVVAPGRLQIEAGTPSVDRSVTELSGSADAERTNRVISFPTLLRAGMTDWLELRASSGIYSFEETSVEGAEPSETSTEGFPGVTLGAKAQLLDRPGAALALIPRVALPLGDDDFTNPDGRLGFSTDAVLAADAGRGVGLTLVAGGALDPSGPTADGYDYRFTGLLTGNASRSITEQVGGYVEGVFQPREDSENGAFLGAGLTYQPVPTAQLDVFFDRGLTDGSTDWLFGGGISIRFGD